MSSRAIWEGPSSPAKEHGKQCKTRCLIFIHNNWQLSLLCWSCILTHTRERTHVLPATRTKLCLTNWTSNMWTTKVDSWMRNSSHSNLIIATRQETSKGAGKWNGASTCSTAYCHTNEVLFSNKAFHVSFGVGLLEGEWEGGVLCVAIHGHHSVTGVSNLGQGSAIGNSYCHLCIVKST